MGMGIGIEIVIPIGLFVALIVVAHLASADAVKNRIVKKSK